jgi:hypothetical protein
MCFVIDCTEIINDAMDYKAEQLTIKTRQIINLYIVLYECEIRFLTQKEEYTLRMLVLRRIFNLAERKEQKDRENYIITGVSIYIVMS